MISKKPLNILYIHLSGVFGGASRSLLELLKSFPENHVNPIVLCPEGSAADAFRKQEIEIYTGVGFAQFDNTVYGYYRGFRWLILLRELFFLPFTFFTLLKIKNKFDVNFDIIHINEITMMPTLVLASFLFRKPVVLHIRSVQRGPDGLRSSMITRLIKKFTDDVIVIDETVNASLEQRIKRQVIHNGFDPYSKINDDKTNPLKNLVNSFRVAMVGNILFMKGVEEFVKAAKQSKNNNLKIDFIIVGDKPTDKKGIVGFFLKKFGLSHDAKEFVQNFIRDNQLEENVHLINFTSNITDIYKEIDVLCFPSHLNAAGRPVFEAAFLGKPGIVAVEHPKADTIVHMETGICIKSKDTYDLFQAIRYFYENPAETERMGKNAYKLANENFDVKKNALKVFEVYQSLLNR